MKRKEMRALRWKTIPVRDYQDFGLLSMDIKRYVRDYLTDYGITFVKYRFDRFNIVAIVKNMETEKYAMFTMPDVRATGWHENILVYLVKNETDKDGSHPRFCHFDQLKDTLVTMTK